MYLQPKLALFTAEKYRKAKETSMITCTGVVMC